eukprot:6491797-Amphidinium_carterae.1
MPALASIGYQFIKALKLRGSVTGVTFFHQVHYAMASMLERFVLSDARKVQAGVVPEMLVCCLGCGCDLHNSLKWAYQSLWPDSGTPLTDLYICHWHQLSRAELAPCSHLKELYGAFSVRDELLKHLLDCELLWSASEAALFIASEFISEVVDNGCSSTLSRMTNFHAFYAHMHKQGILSEWEASGADKIGEVEMCAVLLSLVSYIPEALVSDLLADNRLLMQVGRLQAAMQALSESSWLEHLSSSFWGSGLHVLCAGQNLDHPWSLVVGVIAENVQAFSELADCLSNGVARKMWALL